MATSPLVAAAIGLALAALLGCAPSPLKRSQAGNEVDAAPEETGGSGGGGSGGSSTAGGGESAGGSGGGGAGGSAMAGAGGTPDAGAPPADTAADDASATDATGPGGDGGDAAPFPPGPHKVVLLVGDTNMNDQSRIQLLEILASMKDSHGIVVEVMDSRMAKASVLMDKALVIAGPNNNYCSDNPDPSLKTLPVPLMVTRDCRTTMIGLGTMMNTQEYTANLPVKIVISNSDHPLAAGLKGEVPVLQTRCRLVRGSGLGPGAIKIAKAPADATPANADSWPIFAYEKGAMMVGGVAAPAKRVGFFWHRPSAVTPEGKKLFIAAIEWAIRP